MPACIFGCNVLTLPPSISGEFVYSETSKTFKFKLFYFPVNVPPELTSSILYLVRAFKIFFKVFLSETEINAFSDLYSL